MATWMAHLRLAQHFMAANKALDNPEFLVGNIGPDCGVPNEDWSAFTPDKTVTHWMRGGKIDAEDFRRHYLRREDDRYPFYLGYYFHLLTDLEWIKLYDRKKVEPLYAKGLAGDKNFIWEAKKDWYGQDHLYLQSHPGCVFYTMFAKIESFENRYFESYPPQAFIRQVRYITQFYLEAEEDASRPFPYLSKAEMDGFVAGTIPLLEERLAAL